MRAIKGKKILVAGGTGLIGSSLTPALLAEGARVTASYFSKQPKGRTKHRKYDFTAFEDCLKATAGQDAVFVCAAQISGVKGMAESPTASLLPNLRINAGLLEAALRNKVKTVVLISSSTVYQEAEHPIKEEQLDLNLPPYQLYLGVGGLNRYLEQLAWLYQEKFGMRIKIVRPTNVFGPHDRFEGEGTHVLPALIRRAVKKEDPFVVWGEGAEVRDFIYVEDLISDLLDIFSDDRASGPINVGSGQPLTVKEAVGMVLRMSGHQVAPQYDRTRPTAIPYRMLDLGRFESLFGKKPRTSFAEGIKKTIEWYRKEHGC